MDGRSTSSHDNKKFRTRSVEKQRGMAFGLRKLPTDVKRNRTDFVIFHVILYLYFIERVMANI